MALTCVLREQQEASVFFCCLFFSREMETVSFALGIESEENKQIYVRKLSQYLTAALNRNLIENIPM